MSERDRPVTLAHRLEAALAWGAYAVIGLLPVGVASAVGGWIGRTIGPRLGKSRLAQRNIRNAMPELDEAQVARIVHDMWDNLGRTIFEFPHLRRIRTEGPDPRVEIVGLENLIALRDDGLPGFFVTAHLANWEVTPKVTTHGDLPIHMFYRAPNNPLIEPLFSRRYRGPGSLLPKGRSGARQALRLMQAGEHLGVVVDQKMNDGIAVPFFGRDAMTAPAVAQLALRFRCPVVQVRTERLGGCRFRITVEPPLELPDTGDRNADVLALMTRINATVERWVRERPGQWFWVHRRWPD